MPSSRALLGAALAACALVTLVTAAAAPAAAKPRSSTTTTGNDISWPQCGTRYPSGQAFGIVGLTGGLANDTNSCFASEFAWAQGSTGATAQPKAAIYVNTGNPSGAGPVWWPTSNTFYSGSDGTDSNTATSVDTQAVTVTNPYGDCAPSGADVACSYVYGWAKAYEDLHHRYSGDLTGYQWWLDVETTNSWETPGSGNPDAYAANVADLRGMVDVLHASAVRVGVYSTPTQWGQITGTVSSTSADPFAGLPDWVAGASAATASSFCTASHAFTYGSRVALVQYVARRLDYDIACP